MMLRKQVVSLTSVILMVALITNIAGWIQDAEATPAIVIETEVTHSCIDSNSGHPWNDICQTVVYDEYTNIPPGPNHPGYHPGNEHDVDYLYDSAFEGTSVTTCSQCPNPPFTHYN